VYLAGHAVHEKQFRNPDPDRRNEKQKEKLAADHFFSSLLEKPLGMLGTENGDSRIILRIDFALFVQVISQA